MIAAEHLKILVSTTISGKSFHLHILILPSGFYYIFLCVVLLTALLTW